ncbi:phosphatase PAP2 family protein [cf. Phormidesmis sp. LEGE 11477]|uniref:phosphatase PAP2 family protein n=1 Tax=cf. Phormidesmis sp. LEGE 11477 TaxID=1828680 RepID=UPI00187E7772|nr:phosphatase PAP2 family protein [cf. Phormidesmis sp. LEGE 11477]MBE9060397.1 phosphatase PAP2 family protein [cf. Phormidesmis sp. LEGE 11477]
MQQLFNHLAYLWTQKVNPKIASFVAFFGIAWLAACALTLYVLAHLSDEILERESFAFDKHILLYIHQFANPVLDAVMVGITRLGDPRTVVPLTVIIFCFLWWQRYQLEAKFFALNAIGGAVLSYVLKLVFNRPRPQLWPQLISETTFSYPSGHALGSMVLYGFLSYLLITLYPRYSLIWRLVGIFLIVAIGFSRLYLGVHWPTDILAGYGIGFLWITVCIVLMRLQEKQASVTQE